MKDVANRSIVTPLNRMFHTVELGAGDFSVTVARVFPGYEDLDPPHQPPGADSELKLGQCLNWSLKWPQATYFDSHWHVKKDYTILKNVLDNALAGFRHRIGTKLEREFLRRGSLVFNHKTDFPCVTQPEDSPREAFFTIMFMREMVRDVVEVDLPDKMVQWRQNLCDTSDPQAIPTEFGRI